MPNFNELPVVVEAQQTVSDTALALSAFSGITAANVKAASRMWLIVNTFAVRLFYGGTTPATDTGIKISAGEDFVLVGRNNIAKVEIIRDASSDSEVVVVLEG